MHRQFLSKLPEAKGFSVSVIAIFFDIREFSSFAGVAESVDAALFLRKMYLKILENYFHSANFFKPTGDGLMIIYEYEEPDLDEIATVAIGSGLSLIADFPGLLSEDRMLTFEPPDAAGIGMARGSSTRLGTIDLTLDYSGRPLNIAARLMDLARPLGVVLDETMSNVIPPQFSERFVSDNVYIKGIAESKTRLISVSDEVFIPNRAHQPFNVYQWRNEEDVISLHQAKIRAHFSHAMSERPALPNEVGIRFEIFEKDDDGNKSGIKRLLKYNCGFEDRADGLFATFDYAEFLADIEHLALADDADIGLLALADDDEILVGVEYRVLGLAD